MEKNERILALIDDLNDYRETLKQAEMDLEKSIAWIERVKGWIKRDEDEIDRLKEKEKVEEQDFSGASYIGGDFSR